MKKLDYIDGLKGIGALMVFFCHFVFAFYYAAYSLTEDAVNTASGIEIAIGRTPLNLLYSGNAAVCLFLVFSGFVLCLSYFRTRDKKRLKAAAWKRYFRLMPMILMVNMAIFILMSLGLYRNDEAAILTKSTVWFAGFNQFQPNALQMLGESLGGMQGILRVESVICIIVGILVLLFLKGNKENEREEDKKSLSLKDIGQVLKTPAIWLITLIVICCYSVYLGSTYLTPYFTNVIGATASFAAVLAIMRSYILQFACGPTGGVLADKMKSISKVVAGCYILIVAALAVILVLPTTAGSIVPMIVLMILLCAGIFAMRGIYFATIDEANIPMHVTGTAVGIVSLIGFTPDVFMSPICGKLLDSFEGAAGYRAIFILMMAFAVVGLAATFILLKTTKKKAE